MKKIARITLGIMLAMSLVACGDKKSEDTTNEVTTEAVVTTEAADTEEMLTEEEVNRALTNYIHATFGEDYGEDLPEGTQCYWYVKPLYENTYEGQLHAATGSIMYFYIDPYLGKTDICELSPVSDDPEYVMTVNFRDYLY